MAEAAAMWETGPEACAGQRARPPSCGRAGASALWRTAAHGSRGPDGWPRPLAAGPEQGGGRGRLPVRGAEAGPDRVGAGAFPASVRCRARPAAAVWPCAPWEGRKLARSSPRSAGARLWQRRAGEEGELPHHPFSIVFRALPAVFRV